MYEMPRFLYEKEEARPKVEFIMLIFIKKTDTFREQR